MTSTAGYVCCLSQEPTSATTERRKEFYCASEAYPKSNTKPFFQNFLNQLQTQKWVPKNSPHLSRNGVVISSFLNPQWLEGKPQTSKQQQQKLRKERQVPKETLLEEKSIWLWGRELQVPAGYQKGEKNTFQWCFRDNFCRFCHQNLQTIGIFCFIYFLNNKFYYKKIENSY